MARKKYSSQTLKINQENEFNNIHITPHDIDHLSIARKYCDLISKQANF